MGLDRHRAGAGADTGTERGIGPFRFGENRRRRAEGTWVRPDGGYTISIKSVGANGQIEARYFNPNPLPFAKAQALPEGATLSVFFELRAGGYAGSTYELTYDAATDRLKGIYYQAVAKQKFEVYFTRQ